MALTTTFPASREAACVVCCGKPLRARYLIWRLFLADWWLPTSPHVFNHWCCFNLDAQKPAPILGESKCRELCVEKPLAAPKSSRADWNTQVTPDPVLGRGHPESPCSSSPGSLHRSPFLPRCPTQDPKCGHRNSHPPASLRAGLLQLRAGCYTWLSTPKSS